MNNVHPLKRLSSPEAKAALAEALLTGRVPDKFRPELLTLVFRKKSGCELCVPLAPDLEGSKLVFWCSFPEGSLPEHTLVGLSVLWKDNTTDYTDLEATNQHTVFTETYSFDFRCVFPSED